MAGAPPGLRIAFSRSVSKSRRALISSRTGSLRITLTRMPARRKTAGGWLGSGAGGRSGCRTGGGSAVGAGRVPRETVSVTVSAGWVTVAVITALRSPGSSERWSPCAGVKPIAAWEATVP